MNAAFATLMPLYATTRQPDCHRGGRQIVATSTARPPTARLRLLRRSLALVCAATAVVGVGGCGSSFNAQTQQQYQPAVGVSNRDDAIYAINTLVVTDGEGNGTVVSALINQKAAADSLRSVTAVDDQGRELKVLPLPDGGVALPSQQAVQLGNDASVRISSDELQAGFFVTLSFTYADAAPLQVDVPVVDQTSTYADVPVGPRR